MAAATKWKRFQWNKSDKMENLSNFKAQMEYENIETRLNSTRLSGKHKSQAWGYIFFLSSNVSFWPRDLQPKTGFFCVRSSLLAVEYYSKNLKIERQQRVKLLERQFVYYDDSCLHAFWFSWDVSHTISHLASRLTFQPGLKFSM